MRRILNLFILVVFSFSQFNSYGAVYDLPQPGLLLPASQTGSLPVLSGIKIDPQNPLKFQFLVKGKEALSKEDALRLAQYFMAGLAMPSKDIWVNLSPNEQNRVIEDNLGITELGKGLLSQDYILKQLAASLTYPETKAGEQYWKEANSINSKNSTNSLQKVWIMPDKSEVYEEGDTALISKASMRVEMEQGFKAFDKNILPKLQQEVNEGKNFAQLRQIYSALVLAVWFKQKFADSFYRYYIDQAKVNGIDLNDKQAKEKIYNLYLEAFQKGAYNYIKKENVNNLRVIKRNYFCGGIRGPESVAKADVRPAGEPDQVIAADITRTGAFSGELGSKYQKALLDLVAKPKEVYDLAAANISNPVISGWVKRLYEMTQMSVTHPSNPLRYPVFIADDMKIGDLNHQLYAVLGAHQVKLVAASDSELEVFRKAAGRPMAQIEGYHDPMGNIYVIVPKATLDLIVSNAENVDPRIVKRVSTNMRLAYYGDILNVIVHEYIEYEAKRALKNNIGFDGIEAYSAHCLARDYVVAHLLIRNSGASYWNMGFLDFEQRTIAEIKEIAKAHPNVVRDIFRYAAVNIYNKRDKYGADVSSMMKESFDRIFDKFESLKDFHDIGLYPEQFFIGDKRLTSGSSDIDYLITSDEMDSLAKLFARYLESSDLALREVARMFQLRTGETEPWTIAKAAMAAEQRDWNAVRRWGDFELDLSYLAMGKSVSADQITSVEGSGNVMASQLNIVGVKGDDFWSRLAVRMSFIDKVDQAGADILMQNIRGMIPGRYSEEGGGTWPSIGMSQQDRDNEKFCRAVVGLKLLSKASLRAREDATQLIGVEMLYDEFKRILYEYYPKISTDVAWAFQVCGGMNIVEYYKMQLPYRDLQKEAPMPKVLELIKDKLAPAAKGDGIAAYSGDFDPKYQEALGKLVAAVPNHVLAQRNDNLGVFYGFSQYLSVHIADASDRFFVADDHIITDFTRRLDQAFSQGKIRVVTVDAKARQEFKERSGGKELEELEGYLDTEGNIYVIVRSEDIALLSGNTSSVLSDKADMATQRVYQRIVFDIVVHELAEGLAKQVFSGRKMVAPNYTAHRLAINFAMANSLSHPESNLTDFGIYWRHQEGKGKDLRKKYPRFMREYVRYILLNAFNKNNKYSQEVDGRVRNWMNLVYTFSRAGDFYDVGIMPEMFFAGPVVARDGAPDIDYLVTPDELDSLAQVVQKVSSLSYLRGLLAFRGEGEHRWDVVKGLTIGMRERYKQRNQDEPFKSDIDYTLMNDAPAWSLAVSLRYGEGSLLIADNAQIRRAIASGLSDRNVEDYPRLLFPRLQFFRSIGDGDGSLLGELLNDLISHLRDIGGQINVPSAYSHMPQAQKEAIFAYAAMTMAILEKTSREEVEQFEAKYGFSTAQVHKIMADYFQVVSTDTAWVYVSSEKPGSRYGLPYRDLESEKKTKPEFIPSYYSLVGSDVLVYSMQKNAVRDSRHGDARGFAGDVATVKDKLDASAIDVNQAAIDIVAALSRIAKEVASGDLDSLEPTNNATASDILRATKIEAYVRLADILNVQAMPDLTSAEVLQLIADAQDVGGADFRKLTAASKGSLMPIEWQGFDFNDMNGLAVTISYVGAYQK